MSGSSIRMFRSGCAFVVGSLCTGIANSIGAQQRWDLLVSSRGDGSVKQYDGETGAFIGSFVKPGEGGLTLTQELRLGLDGQLLVTGRGNSEVLRYDIRSGAFLGSFTHGQVLREPTKMTMHGDSLLLVSQWSGADSRVLAFDARSGAFRRAVTPSLGQPMQHLQLPNGDWLVVGFDSPQIRRFSSAGEDLGSFSQGAALEGAVNLWRHESGDLLVMEWNGGRIARYNAATGARVGDFISGLTTPEGWALGPDGRLYIAEWSLNRIQRFDATSGASLGVFAMGGGVINPNSVLFIPRPADFAVNVVANSSVASVPAALRVSITSARETRFDRDVTLACAGLPADLRCEFAGGNKIVAAELPASKTLHVVRTPALASSKILGVPEVAGLLAVMLIGHAAIRRVAGNMMPRRFAFASLTISLIGLACNSATGIVRDPESAPADVRFTIVARSGYLEHSVPAQIAVSE